MISTEKQRILPGPAERSDGKSNINLGFLLDFYGELLTERQREIADFYFNDDLSLSEIAELTGLTRQGVRAAVEKSRLALTAYEEKLGLAAKFRAAQTEIGILSAELKKLTPGGNADTEAILASAARLEKLYE